MKSQNIFPKVYCAVKLNTPSDHTKITKYKIIYSYIIVEYIYIYIIHHVFGNGNNNLKNEYAFILWYIVHIT